MSSNNSNPLEHDDVARECGGLTLDRVRVMGILNITRDSFSDGGKYIETEAALAHARRMLDDGAHMIDVGGESTRPGAAEVDLQEELDRVIPVVEALASEAAAVVSVDTSKPKVMQAAVAAGAAMINDVRALSEPGALEVATEAAEKHGTSICLMHMQGTPATMQENPHYTNVVEEVAEFLVSRCQSAIAAGIPARQLVIDPGFGFGKSTEHNLQLLDRLSELVETGFPVLAGLSRKRMFNEILTGNVAVKPAEDSRLTASVAAAQIAAARGAKIVRVHDVGQTVAALQVLAWTQAQGKPA